MRTNSKPQHTWLQGSPPLLSPWVVSAAIVLWIMCFCFGRSSLSCVFVECMCTRIGGADVGVGRFTTSARDGHTFKRMIIFECCPSAFCADYAWRTSGIAHRQSSGLRVGGDGVVVGSAGPGVGEAASAATGRRRWRWKATKDAESIHTRTLPFVVLRVTFTWPFEKQHKDTRTSTTPPESRQ